MRTCAACQVNYPDAIEFCPSDGTALGPRPHVDTQPFYDPLIGSTIDGRYIVERILGQGGMGFVYAARHAIIDKPVAIKVLKSEHSRDQTAAERFLAEAKAASKIGHQNIVDITDFGMIPPVQGADNGHAYFVMEFLAGPTLGAVIHAEHVLAPGRAIGITVQIARGLQAAHDKGIIHRDLKPENVFVLERDGQSDVIKIVDFGIARDISHKKRLTQVGMVLGTPEYMSPEQATGQTTDHRVDMYALGCMLYEMMTGDVPFKGETPTKTLTMHVFDKLVPPSQRRPDLKITASLEAVCLRMLEKKPTDRFASLRDTMAALDRVDAELRGRSYSSASRRVPPRTTKTSLEVPRVSRRPLLIAGALGLVALVGVALAVGSGKKPLTPTSVANAARTSPSGNARPPAADPGAAPSAPGDVEMVLHSRPSGVEVFDGPERLGITPVTLHRPRASQRLVLTFRHPGFHDARKALVPDRDLDVEVLLVQKRDRASHPPRASAHPAAQAKQPSSPVRQSDLRNPFD